MEVDEVLCDADTCRSGDDGRRLRKRPEDWYGLSIGELLLSTGVKSSEASAPFSFMSMRPLFGRPGNISSTGFLGARMRLGEPTGLAGRL